MSLILGIVEDRTTREILQRAISDLGFEFISTTFASSDLPEKLKLPISMVLVETRRGQDFRDQCKHFKPICSAPVMVLISRGDEESITDYKQLGVADCIFKPLRVSELKARIQMILATNHPANGHEQERLQCHRLEVDLVKRRVYKDGKEITVTRTGYRLLVYFLEHQSRVVTRDELLHEVWGYTRSGEDRNLVETAIRRLRKEIEDDPKNPECLHTIWGVGYRFEKPD
jgi:DNA-binding response OmpR family regulator